MFSNDVACKLIIIEEQTIVIVVHQVEYIVQMSVRVIDNSDRKRRIRGMVFLCIHDPDLALPWIHFQAQFQEHSQLLKAYIERVQ